MSLVLLAILKGWNINNSLILLKYSSNPKGLRFSKVSMRPSKSGALKDCVLYSIASPQGHFLFLRLFHSQRNKVVLLNKTGASSTRLRIDSNIKNTP